MIILPDDLLRRITLLLQNHHIHDPKAGSVDARPPTTDPWVFGDVGVDNPRRRGCHKLECFYVPLNYEDFLLLKVSPQPVFESLQYLACFPSSGCNHPIDDNFITVGDVRHFPKSLVGLWKEGDATKVIE